MLAAEKQYDVVVVGAGVTGMLAAIRAHDLGLSAIVLEKHARYGGTATVSGGTIWIPNNSAIKDSDSREKAMAYLRGASRGEAREECLAAFVDNAPAMMDYMTDKLGFGVYPLLGYPDYLPELEGASEGRAMMSLNRDGKELGDDFFLMRDPPAYQKAMGRYAIDFRLLGAFTRMMGWQWTAVKMVLEYWSDLRWRFKTKLDSKLTFGRALVGTLRKAMLDRGIPLVLEAELVDLEKQGGRISAALFVHKGEPLRIAAARAVLLAGGGFEQNQEMRDKHLPVATRARWSLGPPGGTQGDTIRIGDRIGAQIENTDRAWWSPSHELPVDNDPATVVTHPVLADRGLPHSMCVDRDGHRFVNESVSYDQFGLAMIERQKATGKGVPCWMIFDSTYRDNYPCGMLLPRFLMPDWTLPGAAWDHYVYKARTIEALADKIGIDPAVLRQTTDKMNEAARTGVDPDFHRGTTIYCQYMGDPRNKPNAALGSIDKGPFYAVPLNLGDLGTNGGMRIDEKARVIGTDGRPIAGLYACGNNAASIVAGYYPGAGGTLGPGMTYAYIAAGEIASEQGGSKPAEG